MAYTPPTYTPSGSLFGSTPAATPYTYGNLGNTTSAYNLWGSTGNPYLVAGPTYTPGSGAPINPQPVAPVAAPVNNGGDSSPIPDWVDPSTLSSSGSNADDYGLQNWLNRNKAVTKIGAGLLGVPLLEPALNFAYGVNPITDKSLDWYGGSTDFDNNVYSNKQLARNNYSGSLAAYQADKAAGMTDQTWAQRWAEDRGTTAAPVTFANTVSTPATNAPQSFAQYADPSLVAASNARIAEQNVAIAQAQANNAPAGTVTYSDGSTGSSLSDMQAGSSGSYSSSYSGDVGVTSYGDGQYGFTDTNGEEVGYESPDSGGGDSGGGGGGSYIATAATNALGEGGLKLFEDWRDYMFTALPTFTTSYGRYRVTAPKIVKAIDKKTNSKELYQDIWNEYLKPIFGLIKKDMNNPKALSDYKVMVKELTNKYLKGDK